MTASGVNLFTPARAPRGGWADFPADIKLCSRMVRCENGGMRYGSGPEVLRDVSFSLEPGSFTFLTGLSGAGKTTLLKLIYVAEPPSRGLITLFGAELATAR